MTTSPLVGTLQQVTGRSVHLTRIALMVVAFLANVVVYFIAKGVGANLTASGPGYDGVTKIEVMHVLNGSLSWSVGALIVFMLVERFAPNTRQWWMIAGAIGLLISFFPAFAQAETTGTIVTFVVMHLIAAGIMIPGFAATLRR